jgi:hypothetical protein
MSLCIGFLLSVESAFQKNVDEDANKEPASLAGVKSGFANYMPRVRARPFAKRMREQTRR